jgi:hypothetical protein
MLIVVSPFKWFLFVPDKEPDSVLSVERRTEICAHNTNIRSSRQTEEIELADSCLIPEPGWFISLY